MPAGFCFRIDTKRTAHKLIQKEQPIKLSTQNDALYANMPEKSFFLQKPQLKN